MKSILKITFFFLNFSVFSASMTAQNPSSISGSITLTDETLAGLTTQHGQNLLKTGVIFEVWSVVYRDVMAKSKAGAVAQNTRAYLLQKQTSVNITPSLAGANGNKSINFTVSNIPQQGDFVVLYYFNGYPAQFKLFKPTSKLDDGSNRQGLQYATNAALKIGAGKKFGVLSINKTGLGQTYSTALLANTTGVIAYGLFGDIIDFFEDAADLVWEGGKKLAGVVVNAAGQIIMQAGTISYLLIVEGKLPRYRTPTQAEYDWANTQIFNGTLPSRNSIIITNLIGAQSRQFTTPSGFGQVFMNMGAGYDNPMQFKRPNEIAGQIFIHEMAHTWQIEHNPQLKSFTEAVANQWKYTVEGDKSVYQYTCGKQWNEYNYEQQASIVENAFRKRTANPSVSSCEQQYVEANIRNGVLFPVPRSPECTQLLSNIASVNKQIANRTLALKAKYAEEHDISTVRNPDGTFKVGTEKGTANITLPPSVLNNDATIKSLRAQLKTYTDRKTAINCR